MKFKPLYKPRKPRPGDSLHFARWFFAYVYGVILLMLVSGLIFNFLPFSFRNSHPWFLSAMILAIIAYGIAAARYILVPMAMRFTVNQTRLEACGSRKGFTRLNLWNKREVKQTLRLGTYLFFVLSLFGGALVGLHFLFAPWVSGHVFSELLARLLDHYWFPLFFPLYLLMVRMQRSPRRG